MMRKKEKSQVRNKLEERKRRGGNKLGGRKKKGEDIIN
jgi:hypothetical protein